MRKPSTREQMAYQTIAKFEAERDQLKAENARSTEREIHQLAEIEALKAENAGYRTGYEAYEQVVQGLRAEKEELVAALKGMSSMYGYCWDLVDGGLLCMQHNVQRFEDAHAAAQEVIAAMSKEANHD